MAFPTCPLSGSLNSSWPFDLESHQCCPLWDLAGAEQAFFLLPRGVCMGFFYSIAWFSPGTKGLLCCSYAVVLLDKRYFCYISLSLSSL